MMSRVFYAKLEKGDLIGNIRILGYSHTEKRNRYMDAKCFCGAKFKAKATRLKSGHTKSCGCLKGALITIRNKCITPEENREMHTKAWETRRA